MFCIENLKQRLRALSTLRTNVARKEDVEATAGAEAPEEEEEEEQEDLWWIQNYVFVLAHGIAVSLSSIDRCLFLDYHEQLSLSSRPSDLLLP